MATLDAAVVLVILLGCSALGLLLRPLLSERHRSREAIDFVQLVVAMLMTFAALVLGLLTSSAKSSFDKVSNDLRGLAIGIIQLDRSLREWGAEQNPRVNSCEDTRPQPSPAHGPRSQSPRETTIPKRCQ
jgi:hypothetical protein